MAKSQPIPIGVWLMIGLMLGKATKGNGNGPGPVVDPTTDPEGVTPGVIGRTHNPVVLGLSPSEFRTFAMLNQPYQ